MNPSQILLVEDELDLAEVLSLLLKIEGYDVAYAANGASALDRLAEVTPDLIVTDIMMPVMGGGEFLEALRRSERLRPIPVVVISALPEGIAHRVCKEFNAFLQKPFEADQLIGTARRLLQAQQ